MGSATKRVRRNNQQQSLKKTMAGARAALDTLQQAELGRLPEVLKALEEKLDLVVGLADSLRTDNETLLRRIEALERLKVEDQS